MLAYGKEGLNNAVTFNTVIHIKKLNNKKIIHKGFHLKLSLLCGRGDSCPSNADMKQHLQSCKPSATSADGLTKQLGEMSLYHKPLYKEKNSTPV